MADPTAPRMRLLTVSCSRNDVAYPSLDGALSCFDCMPNLHETEYGILGATVAAASRHGEGGDVVIRDHLVERSNVHCSRFLAARFEPAHAVPVALSLIHISEPTRLGMISYAVFCLKKKKNK